MAKRFFPEWLTRLGIPFAPGRHPSGWALARGTTMLVAAALGALIFVGTLSFYQARDLADTAALTRHTQEVISQMSLVRATLDQLPAATRGFALTGEPLFVDAYEANIAGLDSQLEQLKSLTHDNPDQQNRIALLKRQIAERLDAGRNVFDARRTGGLEVAARLVGSGRGEAASREIRQTLQEMENAEHRLLAQREKASLAANQATFLILPAGTLLSLLILALGVFRLNKEAIAVRNAHEAATLDLLETISDGFFALDEQCRCVRMNSAGLKMIRKTREEFQGKGLWDVFPETRTLKYESLYRKAMLEKMPVRFEEYYPEPLNEWLEIRAYPTGRGLNIFFNNITKRKQTEERLRQLSRAVEQSPSVVMITDIQGHIEYVNPKFTEVTGYSSEEVLGKNPRILRSPSSIPDQGRELWEALKAGKEWRGEFHNRKKNGELYWEYASISPITDEQGNVTHYVAVKENVTRRKMMEASLVEAKKQAEEASKTKDVFLATLSHELRTPLTPVLLAASASENDETLDVDVREQFRVIRNSIELEARLIDDLLDLTKITRGKFSLNMEPFSASEPLLKTLEMLRQDYMGKNLKVEWERSAHSAMICADMARLHQVFWNLLKNAIKFTPVGGAIHIRTFNPNPEFFAVEVRDTGVGIARDFLESVFQPFRQGPASGKPQFGGLGLGLAITKAIVEVHGGSISVDSPGVGRGTKFTVELPVWKGGERLEPKRNQGVPNQRLAPRRILLVEDDKFTRTVLARLLHKDGHTVVAAASCAEALAALSAQPEDRPFESLLCDLGLPDGSGLDLVGPIKERSPGIAAIAFSGYGMAEDIRRSKAAGFTAHLVKPVSIEDLRATLAQAG